MDVVEKKKSKFKLQMPHTWVLLFSLVIIAALFTYFIPSGSYDRVELNGRQIVDATTYHAVEPDPAGLFDILKAFPKGLEQAAAIVFAFGGGVYGMAEEALPFIPALVVLCI